MRAVPPRVFANCNPAMLAWARADAGYTLETAAEKTRYTVERLREWEAGDSKPSIPQLRDLAHAYRRPLSAFFMPEPPAGFQPLHDFRRLPDADVMHWSPSLRALIRRAEAQQRAYVELLADLGEERQELPHPPNENDPEALGTFARELLGIDVEAQGDWRDESAALRGWTRAIEDAGVLVLHTSTVRGSTVTPEEMLGLSDPDPVPVIVLNGKDHVRRRTFTLLHEFAHLLLRRAGVCDLHDRFTTANYDPVEVFCNATAAATLMPRDAFLADPAVQIGNPQTEWDDERLGQIAVRFTTSREAVLRRLLTFELTTESFYRTWREQYNRQFDERRLTDDDEDESRSGGPSYYTMKVRELGLPFMAAALEAYNADAINASDLARLLNIRLKNLSGVEEAVVKAIGRG
jgi:Zn-dependent peptidase ImmA (M78 family)/transcriptional regulator with XRE-family HTH domain